MSSAILSGILRYVHKGDLLKYANLDTFLNGLRS